MLNRQGGGGDSKLTSDGIDTSSGQNSSRPQGIVCPCCLSETGRTDLNSTCEKCGATLNAIHSEPHYAESEPALVPMCHEIYHFRPPVRTVNERRYSRIPYRKVKAAISRKGKDLVVVDLIDISRGGALFASDTEFYRGTAVSIATHYIEGGQNIFQDGRIVRVQRKPTKLGPGEFAIEFTPNESRQ